MSNLPLGIDVGLTSFLATSNGLLVKRPRFFVDAERKLKLLQQRVSKKPKGSNNWKKAQRKVAKLHEYVANCRKDWYSKPSHQICNHASMVFVESRILVSLGRGVSNRKCVYIVEDANYSSSLSSEKLPRSVKTKFIYI